jgi:Ca2+-binding RTX toxin-like protein
MAKIRGTNRNDDLDGRNGNDKIVGLGGNDELDGNGGNDKLRGNAGNDELDGDGGNDTLDGGKGRDELDGGAGNDLLIGGKGADIFLFESRDGNDTIADFKSGSDRIEFDIDNLQFNDLVIRNNNAGDAVISGFDGFGSSITLDGVDAASLSRGDFLFDD